MNIRGYLRWQFEGTLSSPCFYGFCLTMLGAIALFFGCPAPWPMITSLTGLAIVVIDSARSWIRFSYSIYDLEQKQIERELKRKSQ
jgi:hypothetical protein